MLDEIKVKLMTKIAIFEKREEDHNLRLSHFYREDYIKYGCLRTLVTTTISYWFLIAVYILLRFEKILGELNNKDYFRLIVALMAGWIVTMIVFFLYAFIVYSVRYEKGRKKIVSYNKNLKKLMKLYEIRNREAHSNSNDDIHKAPIIYHNIGGDESQENVPYDEEDK